MFALQVFNVQLMFVIFFIAMESPLLRERIISISARTTM